MLYGEERLIYHAHLPTWAEFSAQLGDIHRHGLTSTAPPLVSNMPTALALSKPPQANVSRYEQLRDAQRTTEGDHVQ